MVEYVTKVTCDRCNKGASKNIKYGFGFVAKHELQKKKFRLINRSNSYSKVDLCRECQLELEEWFNMKRGE